MHATLIGPVEAPAVAITGTWNLLFPVNRGLLTQMVDAAHRSGRAAVAIMLDPPPSVFINGPWGSPLYADFDTRVARLRAFGLDAVLCIHFEKADLRSTVADFFDLVCQHLPLEAFWLREGQTLGNGGRGDRYAVLAYTKRHHIQLRVLREGKVTGRMALRAAIHRGQVWPLIEATGTPPVFSQSVAGQPLLAWAPGRYLAVPLAAPTDAPDAPPAPVNLVAGAGPDALSAIVWPPSLAAPYLAFVQGPGDAEGAVHAPPQAHDDAHRQAPGLAHTPNCPGLPHAPPAVQPRL